MKGLTPHELIEITEFVQKHHKFGYVRDEDKYNGHEGYCIKYIDACYDSRQGDYWAITFRGAGSICFTTNAFGFDGKPKGFEYNSLYEWIMAFLKYEWQQEGKAYDFMSSEKEGRLHNSFPNGEMALDFTEMDMINAYCADLEDGATSEDIADACKFIITYRDSRKNISK